jgi:hypothetical protein
VLFYLGQSPTGIAPAGARLCNDIFLITAPSKKNIAVLSVKEEKKREEEKKKKKAIKISCYYIKLYRVFDYIIGSRL